MTSFEAAIKLFNFSEVNYFFSISFKRTKLAIEEQINYFFVDYDLIPLLI